MDNAKQRAHYLTHGIDEGRLRGLNNTCERWGEKVDNASWPTFATSSGMNQCATTGCKSAVPNIHASDLNDLKSMSGSRVN